ncbi:MAG: UDP-N-acetylmuramate dehydrogenase [Prevotellaceae bacterium]|jgi:UDP-N-acetylmuramate dehydrogenase|nr:UDP-N-acetylmuramate dehydrogenase [Prevotellaceae bacterium]
MINNTKKNKSLKPFTTFGFEARARYFAAPETLDEIENLLADAQKSDIPLFILGGGSNVVFACDFDGLVICPRIGGIKVVDEDGEHVLLKAGAGVVWDDFVRYAVEHNLGGVENLSAIPGNVGASPVQNIGAYGMEAKDSLVAVNGVFIENGKQFTLENAECRFAYRDSIFKNELKRKTVVTHVVFKLSKNPEYKLDYGNLKDELSKYDEINLRRIRQSVIAIRASKLPDPKDLGNAGSFFKNPIVDRTEANRLLELYPSMPVYPADSSGKVKLSAGWMIEKCSLKGYRENNIGVHRQQALVLVNYGEGTASELIAFAQMMQTIVFEKFGVIIEPEVNIIN